MGRVGNREREWLQEKFGDRVCFRKTERKLYGHDIAAIPGLIKPLLGGTTPDAVVQPQSEEDLLELVRWASERRVPLTPRGKASSGYGGVLPVKKGVVVDFYRMNRVVSVDADALTATVQAGVIWEKLDRELGKHGMTLRLYPTSYPASTVGGWLAQGGAGIGSYEAGWFRDNVVSARVVGGDGSVREFAGSELGLIADAEGITGLISEVTVRVRPLEELRLIAIGCPDAHDLQRLLQSIVDERLPIWSLVFINPRMAEMKNRAPLLEHYGHPVEERVLLPAAYVVTLAVRAKDHEAVMSGLAGTMKACEAEILSDRIAQHEWDHRFKLMVVKRLGPSLVPAEVVIPLSALGDVMKEIERKVHQPVVKEGVAYFAGCTASYVEHDIAMASVRLLDAAGVDFTYVGEKESCCGTPMLVAGKWDVFAEVMRKNIAAVKEAGADTVVSSCPACDMMWRHAYPEWAEKLGIEYGITAKHYSEVLAEKIQSGEFKFPKSKEQRGIVTWHDSCHIGRVSGVYDAPRRLIEAVPNTKFVEMSHHHQAAHCCGSVLTLLKDPPVAADVGKTRLDEAIEAGAEKVLALCPCCEFQFRVTVDKKGFPLEVVDLARFAASALGYEFPEPNPEVQKQWAVFEAMIALMTPQGFADLMGTMWPELVDAMPLGMGRMMRVMGKVPGALNLMKPVFPILFPRLLPMMMPKVMPVMLERVGERIPMPDYMAEQMPELMPKVMDSLMPHMIGDVVPLVTQPLIHYLRNPRR